MFLLLVSCTSELDRRLEATLSFAGANRAELEKVLHHYRDEPQKLEAARFLIVHMKDRHFYRSAGIDSIRHYLTVAAGQESCLPFDVERKWGAYDYRQEAPVYDAQVLTADYLIENIEEVDVYLLMEGISYDVMSRTIRRGSESVRLAPQAAALFLLFLRAEGHRVTSEEINRSLWYGKGSKSVVHAAIKRLRGRLKENGLPLEFINHGDCYLLKKVCQ